MISEPSASLPTVVTRSACAITLATLLTSAVSAQEPTLRPLSDHLERGEENPSVSLRYAANRCSALFSLISARREARGDAGTAEMYAEWVIGFGAVALRAAADMGRAAREALRENEEAVDEIEDILNERMSRNMASGGSYLADDPLLSSDVRTCRDLVDRHRL